MTNVDLMKRQKKKKRDKYKVLPLHSRLESAIHSRSVGLLGCISASKVSLVGLLEAEAIRVKAAGRVVLTGLCTDLCWRLSVPRESGRNKLLYSFIFSKPLTLYVCILVRGLSLMVMVNS